SQVCELARSRLPHDKVAVLVGGTSVLHGTCQKADEVWTRRLQALLGDRYAVLNLGVRAGWPQEFGAGVAEVLAREHPKLLFVADLPAHGTCGEPDGLLFRYFFWEAHARGLLLPDPARDESLRQREQGLRRAGGGAGVEAAAELQRRVRLDGPLHFNDL